MGAPKTPIDVTDWMATVNKRLKALEAAAASRPALTTVNGDLVVGGSIHSPDFDGTGPSAPGTQGWWLGGDEGDAIINSLILRDGIIGDDALTNPVAVDSNGVSATAFSITTTQAVKTSLTLHPPSWAGNCIVMAVGDATGVNTSASLGFLTGAVVINGTGGGEQSQPASASNGTGSVTVSAIRQFNPGTLITVQFQVWSQSVSFGTNGANIANLNAIAVYLRS